MARKPGPRYCLAPVPLAELIAAKTWSPPALPAAVPERWLAALPAALRAHVALRSWSRGTLGVTVDGSVWAQELRLAAPEVIRKLNAGADPKERVQEIRIRLGRL